MTTNRNKVNKLFRSVFQFILRNSNWVILLIGLIAFFNYWSVFYLVSLYRGFQTESSQVNQMTLWVIYGYFYGFFGSMILIYLHSFILKYMFCLRKIKSAISFILLHFAYFISLLLLILLN
ncbi:hypothetical protein COC46_01075 [Bacillus sp. AFS041924]|nr:hypothetical protein COC46_01075 [Bacillus sp. AFS041924]